MVQFDIEEPKNEDSDAQDSPSVVTRCLTDNFNVDKRARLSMVSRQYDIDGDGVLDEAEQALRNLDKSGRGFLKTEEVYSMMNDHLKMQKDLFKMKKVIGGLVAFTVLLAISNLGTSLAAAWLSKDTSTSNGAFVDKATFKTLSTQQEKEKFHAEPVSEQRRLELVEGCTTARRKLGNGSNNGNGNASSSTTCIVNSYLEINHLHGQQIIGDCAKGNTVSVCRDFQFDGAVQNTNVCKKMCDSTTTFQATDNGQNGNNKIWLEGKADVNGDGTYDATIKCSIDTTLDCVIEGTFFKQANEGMCDTNSDCTSNNCVENTCIDVINVEPANLLGYGGRCVANSDCKSDVCLSDACGCTIDDECDANNPYAGSVASCNAGVCEYQVDNGTGFEAP